MDGLKRQERKRIERELELKEGAVDLEDNDGESVDETPLEIEEDVVMPQKKERKSFLDKFTEKVKDFLDNAE